MKTLKQTIQRVYSLAEIEGPDMKGEFLHGIISYYDASGKLIDRERSDADSRYTNFYELYEDGDRSCEYGPHGLVDSITTRMGELVKVKRFVHGADGSFAISDNYICLEDCESELWREEYDPLGNLVREDIPANPFTSEGMRTLDYEYDDAHRLVSVEGVLGSEYYTARYRYNDQGQRVQMLTATTDWDYEGDNDMDESDEAPMHFEEVEYQYRADGTLAKANTYRCRACSLDAFLSGNYTRELHHTLDSTTEEVIVGNRLVRTEKEYTDGVLQATATHVYSHPDGELLETIHQSIERGTITTTEYQYWAE